MYLFLAVLSLHCFVGFSLVAACGLLVGVASLVGKHSSVVWHTDSAAPWPVGSSRIRDQTCVPCIGRRILYLWTPKEALEG